MTVAAETRTPAYHVHCQDCRVDEGYDEKHAAVLRMVNHAKVTDHTTIVREVTA